MESTQEDLELSPSVYVKMTWNEEIIPGKESIARKMKRGLFFSDSPLQQTSEDSAQDRQSWEGEDRQVPEAHWANQATILGELWQMTDPVFKGGVCGTFFLPSFTYAFEFIHTCICTPAPRHGQVNTH